MEALGIGLPVIEAKISYHRPAKYDDLLTVVATCSWNHGIRLQINCQVFRGEELLVEGYTIHAFMNLRTGRPTRPNEELTAKLVSLGSCERLPGK